MQSGMQPKSRRPEPYKVLRFQIPHLVELGVTAVEILPVFEYDELEFQRSPNPRVRETGLPNEIAKRQAHANDSRHALIGDH